MAQSLGKENGIIFKLACWCVKRSIYTVLYNLIIINQTLDLFALIFDIEMKSKYLFVLNTPEVVLPHNYSLFSNCGMFQDLFL